MENHFFRAQCAAGHDIKGGQLETEENNELRMVLCKMQFYSEKLGNLWAEVTRYAQPGLA